MVMVYVILFMFIIVIVASCFTIIDKIKELSFFIQKRIENRKDRKKTSAEKAYQKAFWSHYMEASKAFDEGRRKKSSE